MACTINIDHVRVFFVLDEISNLCESDYDSESKENMHKLDHDLNGEILIMSNMNDRAKLSELINCLCIHDDQQGGTEFSNHSQNSDSLEHHECIAYEILLSHFYSLSAK